MKVNIWSDVRCPFCYIGKRQFEKALEQFPHKDQISVVWKSFELDPYLKTRTDLSTLDYLAESKMISKAQAEEMTQYATQAGTKLGLQFDFEKAIVANSLKAHCLIQFAQTKGLGNAAQEQLFSSHFSAGEDIDDEGVLIRIGTTIGLDPDATAQAIQSDTYIQMVRKDEEAAQNLGIRGVPFFVFNDQYAVSGAQSAAVFLDALQQSWNALEQQTKPQMLNDGDVCSADGICA